MDVTDSLTLITKQMNIQQESFFLNDNFWEVSLLLAEPKV